MKPSIFVGIPIHRSWSHESQTAFENNLKNCKNYNVKMVFRLYEESLIQRARHTILQEFLKSNCDYLFWLDDDIVLISPDTIEQLISCKKDIMGGLYICKKPPYHPCYLPFEAQYHDFRKQREPVKVRYASTGCLLISKKAILSVYERHEYPFECYKTMINKGNNPMEEIYLSEDWAFCDRANKLGFNVWINPKPIIAHLGTYAFSINDYYSMLEVQQ